jgi:hypothetical protein
VPQRHREEPPLDWAHVNRASRITLPTYPALFATVGTLLIGQNPSRTSNDAFDVAKVVAPLWLWGLGFLVIAAVELVALVTKRRVTYMRALYVGAGVAAFWGAAALWSAIGSPFASYTAAAWVCATAVFQAATAYQLGARRAT